MQECGHVVDVVNRNHACSCQVTVSVAAVAVGRGGQVGAIAPGQPAERGRRRRARRGSIFGEGDFVAML